MEYKLKIGLEKTVRSIVTKEDTAASFGSGDILVYASPVMIGLMENAAYKCVDEYLDNGFSTVGINVNVNHLKATSVGSKVSATATLSEVKGKKLTFILKAHDEDGLIGEGTHVRYIVNSEEFLNKVSSE